jgi:hypothetical protein
MPVEEQEPALDELRPIEHLVDLLLEPLQVFLLSSSPPHAISDERGR